MIFSFYCIFFGLKNIPKGAFDKDCMAIIKTAAPILTGILLKMLLDIKTTELSIKVRTEMLIIPKRGVHIKNLLYMKEER